ncbi:hypothetical protein V8F20_009048 [Naviculisporaceae sp. PSN 640]
MLPDWAQQLAGILPLTALIEFTDLPTKLHVFELAGGVPFWNWPVTPSGARLLLSTLDNWDACCLDREERSTVLQCVDGRYGDCYPSSTPTTTRLAVASKDSAAVARTIRVPNPRLNMPRCQSLTVVLLGSDNDHHSSAPANARGLCRSDSWARLRDRRTAYYAFSITGWIALCGLLAASLLCGLYIALAYLVVLPLTGLVVHRTHGGPPRRLADETPSEFRRMVVCTSSWNGTQWYAFVGGSRAVNSLLNKPLFRPGGNDRSRLVPLHVWGIFLQILIAGQWALAVASCAVMDWNAMIISVWITFCALSTGYLMRPKDSVSDWLREGCRIKATPITTTLSSRRALLSALVYLNPDTKEGKTSWINPILAQCEERKEWESALLHVIETGKPTGDEQTKKYWWKFITEGLEIGKAIESIIGEQTKRRCTHGSASRTGSEAVSFTTGVHKV